ncbi:MAG: PEP-CTERM sorting domain-containing protein [Bryobacteraceae bacterium]|jgi:hypothetical protein
MIKRILMTAVLVGGMCGVSSFANTFVVGVENNPSATDINEGIGDYNDLMLQFSAVGLTATTPGGSWSAFNSGIVNESGAGPSNPFWDNYSLDDPGLPVVNTPKNIGYCLTTANCGTANPPVTDYLSATSSKGLPANTFTFTFSGPVGTILLGGITSTVGNTDESLGIYNTANGATQWIIQGGVNVVGSSFTPSFSSFGLIFKLGANTFFYSQNSLPAYVNGVATSLPDSRFALFQYADAVPEPGTMVLFGIGALALGLIPRLRKRS